MIVEYLNLLCNIQTKELLISKDSYINTSKIFLPNIIFYSKMKEFNNLTHQEITIDVSWMLPVVILLFQIKTYGISNIVRVI